MSSSSSARRLWTILAEAYSLFGRHGRGKLNQGSRIERWRSEVNPKA